MSERQSLQSFHARILWSALNMFELALCCPGNARCFDASFGEGARDRLTLMSEAVTPAVVSCFILINLAHIKSCERRTRTMPVRITTKRMDCQGVSNLVSMTCTALKRVLRCRICFSIFRGVAKWHNLRGVWFCQRSQPFLTFWWLCLLHTLVAVLCKLVPVRLKCRRKTSLARKLFEAKPPSHAFRAGIVHRVFNRASSSKQCKAVQVVTIVYVFFCFLLLSPGEWGLWGDHEEFQSWALGLRGAGTA